MKNFDGIIFDIDGTLAATNELIFASFNHVAEKYLNKRFTNEEIVSQFGPPEDVILKKWMHENFDSARHDYYHFYQTQHDAMASIFPGLTEAITSIKKHNIKLGIFTGKGKDSSVITLRAIDVYDFFDLIITGDDVKEHKPSPEGIHKFMETYNLNNERVLMIGDSIFDINAAKGAGIKSALVLWDDFSRLKYGHLQADFIFNSVDEFRKFIHNNI